MSSGFAAGPGSELLADDRVIHPMIGLFLLPIPAPLKPTARRDMAAAGLQIPGEYICQAQRPNRKL